MTVTDLTTVTLTKMTVTDLTSHCVKDIIMLNMASRYVTSALDSRLLEHFNHLGKVWSMRVLLHHCEQMLELGLFQSSLFLGEQERLVITFYSDGGKVVCVCVYMHTCSCFCVRVFAHTHLDL